MMSVKAIGKPTKMPVSSATIIHTPMISGLTADQLFEALVGHQPAPCAYCVDALQELRHALHQEKRRRHGNHRLQWVDDRHPTRADGALTALPGRPGELPPEP